MPVARASLCLAVLLSSVQRLHAERPGDRFAVGTPEWISYWIDTSGGGLQNGFGVSTLKCPSCGKQRCIELLFKEDPERQSHLPPRLGTFLNNRLPLYETPKDYDPIAAGYGRLSKEDLNANPAFLKARFALCGVTTPDGVPIPIGDSSGRWQGAMPGRAGRQPATRPACHRRTGPPQDHRGPRT